MTSDELWNKLLTYKNCEFPTIEDFATEVGLNAKLIEKAFKMWVVRGKLSFDGESYSFPKIKQVNEQRNMLTLVKYLMATIGFILTICSIHFTYQFNTLAMNKLWAFLLSLSTVMFMSFAFTIRSYIRKKHVKLFIVVLWTIGILYSVFTAVSGQYNDFRDYNKKDSSVSVSQKRELYKNQLKNYETKYKALLHYRKDEEEYNNNTDLKVENPRTWSIICKRINELNECERQIEEINEKLFNLIDEVDVTDETVYNWLSRILKINANIIQLLIILLPAIFIDLCSTICFSFAFGKNNT